MVEESRVYVLVDKNKDTYKEYGRVKTFYTYEEAEFFRLDNFLTEFEVMSWSIE